MPGNRQRRGWREEAWPKGTCPNKTRPGHRAGKTRSARWSGYVKQQRRIRSCGSPRFPTISTIRKGSARLYFSLKKEAAPGVDGETWRHCGETLEDNLQHLSHRLKRGAYRA